MHLVENGAGNFLQSAVINIFRWSGLGINCGIHHHLRQLGLWIQHRLIGDTC